jgi:hypothetical protein
MVTGGAVDATAKPKGKKVFKVRVDGKRLKFKPVTVGLAGGGGTIGFLVSGAKVARGLRGISKTVLVSCVNDLSVQTFPFTTTDCLASYVETRARPLSMKVWQGLAFGETEVTFDSYEPGVRVAGRVRSVVPAHPSNPDLPPVTLVGEFRGPVTLGDPTR